MDRREENRVLTQTGPGTPMGALFRRYWIPALLASELPGPDCPPVRVQLLGERLIAFRDTEGKIGLLDEFCAHRRVSLWFGRNEECGLRCSYHGWKYDTTGQCVDLPSHPELAPRMKLKAYPCIEQGEVIWTYMGPAELQPATPAYEWSLVPDERRYLSKRFQECNYLQAVEGGIDSSHVSFLHQGALRADPLMQGSKGNRYNQQDLAPVFEVEEFDGGLLIAARRTIDDERYYWRITPWLAPFYTLIPPRGRNPVNGHAWVPIDDEHCWAWSLSYHPRRPLTDRERAAMDAGAGIHIKYLPGTFQSLANKDNDYLMDRKAQKAGILYSGVEGIGMQDASLQESMGAVVDRSLENLVGTDRGIVMMRRALLRAAEANQNGGAIPGIDATTQQVRSCAVELPRGTPFQEGARAGLFPELFSDPVTV